MPPSIEVCQSLQFPGDQVSLFKLKRGASRTRSQIPSEDVAHWRRDLRGGLYAQDGDRRLARSALNPRRQRPTRRRRRQDSKPRSNGCCLTADPVGASLVLLCGRFHCGEEGRYEAKWREHDPGTASNDLRLDGCAVVPRLRGDRQYHWRSATPRHPWRGSFETHRNRMVRGHFLFRTATAHQLKGPTSLTRARIAVCFATRAS